MSLSWRRWAWLAAGLIALPAALLVAAFMLELAIDISPGRQSAQRHATEALGRPVLTQGPLVLKLRRSLGIELQLGRLRIQNPAGFSQADLLVLDDASAELDLIEALRGRSPLKRVEVGSAALLLERKADGHGNWAAGHSPATNTAPADLDLAPFKLHRLNLRYQDSAKAHQYELALQELSGSARAGEDVQLSMLWLPAAKSSAEAKPPLSLSIAGAPLAGLLTGQAPWPFQLAANFDGASLRAEGQAQLQSSPKISLTALSAKLGDTEFEGRLTLALDAARPRLSGDLKFATLDLQPWLPARESEPPAAGPQPFALRRLVPAGVDLQLDLSVDRWLGLPVELGDSTFALRSEGQTASLKFNAKAAGLPFDGQLDLDTRPASPRLALQLGAADLALEPLLQQLDSKSDAAPPVHGQLGRLDLRLSGSGETLDDLLPRLEFSLAAAAARLNIPRPGGSDGNKAAAPLTITLDRLSMAARAGGRLSGQASGSLLGQSALLSVRAGSLEQLWRELAAPLELDLKLKPSQMSLRLQGQFKPSAWRDTALSFAFKAPSSGDLAPYLSLAPTSRLAVDFKGQLQLSDAALQLSHAQLKLGRSALLLDAYLSRVASAADGHGQISRATLHSPLLDMAELSTLRVVPRQQPTPRSLEPLLASMLSWPDADLDLSLQRVVLERPDLAELKDLHLQARLRDGRLAPSALGARIAGQKLQGQLAMDPRAEPFSAKLELSSKAIDIGALLRGLGAADALDGRADALQVSLSGQGNSVREFFGQAALEAHISGGSVRVIGAGRRPVTDIAIEQAVIHAAAGQPLWVELNGSVDKTPLKLGVRVGTLAGFTQVDERLPFWLEAQGAGTLLQLEGRVALPLGREGDLTFEVSGDRLDSLNALLRVKLPHWGPWRLRGPVRMNADGYELEQLRLRVGDSQLGGSGNIDLSGPRPRLDARLSGRSVQLADFPTPELSDEAEQAAQAKAEGNGSAMFSLRNRISSVASRAEGLLSAGFLRRFDANVDVVAREVFSGEDRLADGELHLKLKDGRLRLDPAFVNLPGGGMRMTATFDPTGEQIEFKAQTVIERFDYGIIARRMGREGNVQGLFSMNLDLAGKAPTLDTVLRAADGKIDVAVWPSNLRADVFNLWSVNLVLNLIPLFDPGGQPQVNCVVARFDLKDGKLTEDNLTIDTTRVRVHGKGFADLATDELSFVFRPRAKGFALFRLQTPLRVSGTLNNQRIGIHRGDLIGSTIRSVLSPVWLPIERLMRGPNPPDGADICTDPLRASGGNMPR
ncbi:AsmA family protein [Roseateles albus]|uniref:AsmA-like C-terminal region-containing protein n=1 Tax=Roseateles albus TaxID=2987525 RepID=A0ABT5KK77_9BURK|nr:AsmA-like C-terminal region-containing protein [Roseateles albus]MDC8774276.1 AsmA-like C-terminal region-containing protein [Roseateles albus]